MRVAKIVIDLGFGDSGKGAAIDSLSIGADKPVGIRFSGGHQCGHTVYLDKDTSHIHAIYSSVALRGAPTYVTDHCTFYLPTLIQEAEELTRKGGCTDITVHPRTKMTTPYDIAWNRMTEKVNQHGSVGLGIGATFSRNRDTGYKLIAHDMSYPQIVNAKLKEILNYYLDKIRKGEYMFTVQDYLEEVALEEDIFKDALTFFSDYVNVDSFKYLPQFKTWLFEGSQGVMLDMDYGIFPNVTYANTTGKNAIVLCRSFGITPEIYYVTRCYTTRHGNGWIPNTEPVKLINTDCEINVTDEWQGEFRIGEVDYAMLNYAIATDSLYTGTSRKNLIVSCMDQRPGFKFKIEKLTTEFDNVYYRSSPISEPLGVVTVVE